MIIPVCHSCTRLVTPNEARLEGLLQTYTASSVLPKLDNCIRYEVCSCNIDLLRHDQPTLRAMDVGEQVEFILEDNVTVSLRIVLMSVEVLTSAFSCVAFGTTFGCA